MKYPNGIKKENIIKEVKHANRGMNLEYDLNLTNDYYREHNVALIHKKPTPIKATKISYQNHSKTISDGFFECASTTDYNGVYRGYYLDFEAKMTTSKTSFPLSNIHPHQLKHLQEVTNHGGISFIIMAFSIFNQVFLIETKYIFDIMKSRKSVPLDFIKTNGFEIPLGYQPRLDYLKIVDKILGGKNEI